VSGRSDDVVVKLDFQHPAFPLLRQTPGWSGRWGRFRFLANEYVERCDWWVVCEGVLRDEVAVCPPGRLVLVTWEPPSRIIPFAPSFVSQFDRVLSCHTGLPHAVVEHEQQGHPWFVGRSYDQLSGSEPPAKSKLLSIITSDKQVTEGHRRRYELAHLLKEHFGDDADLFGRGIRDFDDKWDVLAPYRYTFAMENDVAADWLTEKLSDCYLAATFPFYFGCTNVANYVEPSAIEVIDPLNSAATIRRMEELMDRASHHEEALPALLATRERFLNHHQLFPLLARLLQEWDSRPLATTETRRVRPEFRPPGLLTRASRRLRSR